MSKEDDLRDVMRGEDEGLSISRVDLEHEDSGLNNFVESIIESFYEDSDVIDFRDALLSRLRLMDVVELRSTLEISKKHFLYEKCQIHLDAISVPKHVEIDYKLNEENLGKFLANEGLESLKRHVKYLIPEEWKRLLEVEAERFEEYKINERYLSGTPG